MVLNATFNNISVISWRSVLLVDETNLIKIRSTHLLPIFYRLHAATKNKKQIENREQVRRSNFN
jgi:hypothetical protein